MNIMSFNTMTNIPANLFMASHFQRGQRDSQYNFVKALALLKRTINHFNLKKQLDAINQFMK